MKKQLLILLFLFSTILGAAAADEPNRAPEYPSEWLIPIGMVGPALGIAIYKMVQYDCDDVPDDDLERCIGGYRFITCFMAASGAPFLYSGFQDLLGEPVHRIVSTIAREKNRKGPKIPSKHFR